jgi:hypothetical protein
MAMPKTTQESLFAKADMSGGEDACWLWQGFVNKRYGIISMGNRPLRAHRVSYMLCKGEIPKGMLVCHSCDTPLCINPKHLWLGSHQNNVDDMRCKARHSHREKASMAKLTEAHVLEIDRLLKEGFSYNSLAASFGVSRHLISRIRNRRVWKSILLENYYDETFSPKARTGHTPNRFGKQVHTRNGYSVRPLPADYHFSPPTGARS